MKKKVEEHSNRGESAKDQRKVFVKDLNSKLVQSQNKLQHLEQNFKKT